MDIKKFVKNHPTFIFANDLAEICLPLAKLGIVYFSHAHIDKQQRLSCLGLKPEFIKLYFEKGYYQFDLHMKKDSPSEQCILWDAIVRTGQSKALHSDFMLFDQGHTFSITYNHGDSKDCYHFATHLGNLGMNELYYQKLAELKQFICYFKEMVAKHPGLRQAYDRKLSMPSGNYLTEGVSLDLLGESFQQSIPHQRFYIDGGDGYLTQQEAYCLQAISLGKTTEEVAQHMGITARTVKAHVRNIKDKFGYKNQFQLGLLYAKIQDLVK